MTVKILAVLATLTVAQKCDRAYFEVPQPAGAKNLKVIPMKLRGTYASLKDSSILQITEKVIVQHKTETASMSKDELDSAELEEVKHDTVMCENSTCIDIKFIGDSIRVKINTTDTLVDVSVGGILRKYKKYYFLNDKFSEGKWAVKKLELARNELTISSPHSEEDIKFLRNLLKTTDTTEVFSPSSSQFKEFVKQGGFRNQEKFSKQKAK